jgi:pimeloyl-ACP methyl ester carboxylesterase
MNTKKILQSVVLELMKFRFKLLSFIAPKKAARLAIDIFSKPHFQKIRERERKFLNNSNIIRIKNKPEDIILYEKGNKDGKPILMVHGWDSNPGSLSGIADKLVGLGYHIYALNVPAHGISNLNSTNMLETADLINKVLEELKDKGIFSFVTHSFGSGAVSFALNKSGIKADKLAFVTSPDKLLEIFRDYKDTIALGDKAYKYMLEYSENRFQRKFEDMVISKVLKKANFNKLLLVHDKNDKILPYHNSENIKKNNPDRSEIFSTEGKGHYRILWDEEVIDKIVSFFTPS